MNILSLGTLLFSSYWRAAGHRVLVLADAGLATHEDNRVFDFFSHPESCAERFTAMVSTFQPEVIFQGDHSTPLIHAGIEEFDVPKIWYSIDTHLHHAWHAHYATLFDLVFVAQKNMLDAISKRQPRTRWLPPFSQRTAEFTSWAQRERDVAFVGTLDPARNPERVRFFDALRQKGIAVHCATGAYLPVYQSSRIVVNQAVKDDLNLRVFEAMGCGCLLVTERITHSLDELFDEGSDYLAYSRDNAGECAEKIIWALEHPAQAEAITRRGYAKVVKEHGETHRATAVLEAMSALVAKKPVSSIDQDTRAAHLAWTFDYCARLALPESLTVFFEQEASRLAAYGRLSIVGRPWTLLVSAGQALKKGNGALAAALLNQIPEVPEDREFRVRHIGLKVQSYILMGYLNQARDLAVAALLEFPDEKEIREIAAAVRTTGSYP
jgi:hypothetical protein